MLWAETLANDANHASGTIQANRDSALHILYRPSGNVIDDGSARTQRISNSSGTGPSHLHGASRLMDVVKRFNLESMYLPEEPSSSTQPQAPLPTTAHCADGAQQGLNGPAAGTMQYQPLARVSVETVASVVERHGLIASLSLLQQHDENKAEHLATSAKSISMSMASGAASASGAVHTSRYRGFSRKVLYVSKGMCELIEQKDVAAAKAFMNAAADTNPAIRASLVGFYKHVAVGQAPAPCMVSPHEQATSPSG